jgi:hypothetical protein
MLKSISYCLYVYFSKTSIGLTSKALTCVAERSTFGAFPAFSASCHRMEQRHQRSPKVEKKSLRPIMALVYLSGFTLAWKNIFKLRQHWNLNASNYK